MRRSLGRMGIFAIALVAVVAGGAIIFFLLQALFPKASQATPAEIALTRATPLVVAELKADFPADFAEMVASIAPAVAANADESQLTEAIVAAKRDVARKYAGIIPQAPDADIKLWINAVAKSMDAVYRGEGAETCSRFSRDGAPALSQLGIAGKYAAGFDEGDALLFSMIAKARSAPDPHGAATPDDWQAVAALMRQNGAPETHLAIVFTPDIANPDFCPAIAEYFNALLTIEGDVGPRVRASFAESAGH